MSTIELAYEYSRGEQTESSLRSILGDDSLVANVVSIAETLSEEEKKILEFVKPYEN